MSLQFRLIEIVSTIVRLGSFSKAAEELYISQPALSSISSGRSMNWDTRFLSGIKGGAALRKLDGFWRRRGGFCSITGTT